jgi:hypothetical protein
MTIEEDLKKAQNYYKKKVSQWNKDPSGFENYIRVENIGNLTKEFNEDKGNPNHDFNDVCRFLKNYETYQQKDALASIISFINDSVNFSADIINILIAATLKACYPNSPEVDEIIKGILTIVIIGGIFYLIASLFSK